MKKLKTFGQCVVRDNDTHEILWGHEYLGDDTLAWYSLHPRHGAPWRDWSKFDDSLPGSLITYGMGERDVYSFIYMWKEYKNEKVIDPISGNTFVCERRYDIKGFEWGNNNYDASISQAIGHHASLGWNLIHSDGPKSHPGIHVDETLRRGQWVRGVTTNCASFMRKMPDDWAECNQKFVEMSNPERTDEQKEFFRSLLNSNSILTGKVVDLLAQNEKAKVKKVVDA